ncbi:MAG: hypothetical protein L6R48_16725, partial [Planctomycetes bacterium]|nr:hypothetical protein [Planctomycetota bacterium]
PVPSARDYDPTIDREVDRVVRRMLSKKPAERCNSLRELIEEFESVEVRLAGTDSVLRKSKGPVRALTGAPPPPRREQQVRPPSPPSPPPPPVEVEEPPVQAGGQRPVPEWLKLVDDHPVPPSPPPPPALGAAPPSPQPATSPSPYPVTSAGGSTPGGRAPSRRLDLELDRARERARRSELNAIAASGDRLAAAGRLDQAASEWQRAAGLASDPGEQAELRTKAKTARQKAVRARHGRRILFSLLGLALVGSAAFALPPHVHGLIADRQLDALLASASSDRRSQVASLRAFADAEQAPWPWYAQVFRRPYAVAAAQRARDLAAELERIPAVQPGPAPQSGAPVPNPVRAGDPAALEAAWADVRVPLAAVVERADALARTGVARAAEIAREARGQLAAAQEDVRRIESARLAGRQREALRLAADFRQRNRRMPEAVLPLPARLAVDSAGNPAPDLTVKIDGVALVIEAGASELPFCRWGERETVVEATAGGFLPARLSVPATAEPADRAYAIPLRLAPAWSRSLPQAMASPWGVRLRAAGDQQLVAMHRDGLLLLRAGDGGIAAQAERAPGAGGFSPLWVMRPSRVLAGFDDGQVVALDPGTLSTEEVVLRGRQEVQAWLDFEMTFQAGRRLSVAVQDVAGAKQVVAFDAGRELWRYSQVKGAQPPFLGRHDDRLLVIDDSRLHFIEEDGSGARFVQLAAPRIGPVVPVAALGGVLVPTTTGVRLYQLGGRQDPAHLTEQPALTAPGPALVAADGDQVLLAGLDASVELLRVQRGGVQRVWRQDGTRQQTWPPLLTGDWAVTCDDGFTVRRRSDGQVALRVTTGAPPAGQPLVVGRLLVVADRTGAVAAYDLKRR